MFKTCKAFYSVRPDFFHHNHIHQRKVQALRLAGIPADMISFVRRSMWEAYKNEYSNAYRRYNTRVIVVPDNSRIADLKIATFFASQLLLYRRILVHFLLSDYRPVLRMRHLQFFHRHLKVIIEYEGDIPSEALYWHTVDSDGGPLEVPPANLLDEYTRLLQFQRHQISQSDAIVVVSKEHKALLSERLGWEPFGVVVPPLFDPNVFRFLPDQRVRIRSEIKAGNSIVFVYLGGVVNKWHRFYDVCQFVATLIRTGFDVRFLALIRKTEVDNALRQVRLAFIEDRSTVLHVDNDQVPYYLSAADIGLMLRHNHTMTRIVSSAKLGEYLACGLPVISTGAHAVFNSFMESAGMMLQIPQSLEIPPDFGRALLEMRELGRDPEWRMRLSATFRQEFCLGQYPLTDYVRVVKVLLQLESFAPDYCDIHGRHRNENSKA
jgi:glycosyltransferase involved in cell wall biosynthesis